MKTFVLVFALLVALGAWAAGDDKGWVAADIPPEVDAKLKDDVVFTFRSLLRNVSFNAGVAGPGSPMVGKLSIGGSEPAVVNYLPSTPVDESIGISRSAMRQCRVVMVDAQKNIIAAARQIEERPNANADFLLLRPDRFAEPFTLRRGKYEVQYRVLGKTLASLPLEVREQPVDGKNYVLADGWWSRFAYLDVEAEHKSLKLGLWANHVGEGSSSLLLDVMHDGKKIAEAVSYPSDAIWQHQTLDLQHVRETTGKSGTMTGKDLSDWDGTYIFVLSRKVGDEVTPERTFELKVAKGKPAGLDLAATTGMRVRAATGEYWMENMRN